MSNDLSLAFIERKPVAAARALTALPVIDAAAYLDSIPSRYAVRVLARISAWPASRMILAMPRASGAGILSALPYMDAAALLRLMQPAERRGLLGKLSRSLRRDLERTMSYPADTVGGQMSIEIVALAPTHTIADAHDALRLADTVNTDTLFLIDEHRRYQGSIPVCTLFRHPAETRLGDLPILDSRPLLARQSLESVADLGGRDPLHCMPVLGRGGHLIGALSLRRFLAGLPQGDRRRPKDRTGATLVEAYFGTASSLLELFADPGTRGRSAQEPPS